MMKEFDAPLVTITNEEYEQLVECRKILDELWMEHSPHSRQWNIPMLIRHRLDRLFDFDDSE
jgi:hypothetical protein